MFIQRELILRKLRHPNILKYYGYCKLQDEINLVLELSTDGALDKVTI